MHFHFVLCGACGGGGGGRWGGGGTYVASRAVLWSDPVSFRWSEEEQFTPGGKVTFCLLTPPLFAFVLPVFAELYCLLFLGWKMRARVTPAGWRARQWRKAVYHMDGSVHSSAPPGCIHFSFIESHFLQVSLWWKEVSFFWRFQLECQIGLWILLWDIFYSSK